MSEPITVQNVKDVELDANKALQVMLNGLEVARRGGKYTFEESYFITQSLYGLQAISNEQQKQQSAPATTSSTTSSTTTTTTSEARQSGSDVKGGDKVMRVDYPKDFNANDYIQVIIRHLEIGQQRGAYSFTDSALIGRAIEIFQKPQQPQQQPQQVVQQQSASADSDLQTVVL